MEWKELCPFPASNEGLSFRKNRFPSREPNSDSTIPVVGLYRVGDPEKLRTVPPWWGGKVLWEMILRAVFVAEEEDALVI